MKNKRINSLAMLMALAGWVSIEAILWVFSHIDISFGE